MTLRRPSGPVRPFMDLPTLPASRE